MTHKIKARYVIIGVVLIIASLIIFANLPYIRLAVTGSRQLAVTHEGSNDVVLTIPDNSPLNSYGFVYYGLVTQGFANRNVGLIGICTASITYDIRFDPGCNAARETKDIEGVGSVDIIGQTAACTLELPSEICFSCPGTANPIFCTAPDRQKGTVEISFYEPSCDPCDSPTEWTECADAEQSRTVYVCGEETDYECINETETRECVMPQCDLASECDAWCAETSCLKSTCLGEWTCVGQQCVWDCYACSNLYWFDDNSTECNYGEFCGEFMYEDLRTFNTFTECEDAFDVAHPPDYTLLLVILGALGIVAMVLVGVIFWRVRR